MPGSDERPDAERVRGDEWHSSPGTGFEELNAGDSLEKRRRRFLELRDRGMV